jgi:hypothetical protein
MPLTNDLYLRLVREINEIRASIRKGTGNLPLFDIDSENTPPILETSPNDLVPGNYDVLRLSADSARSITGIADGVKGRKLRIFNVGNFAITLVYQSSLSAAQNRFAFVNGADFIIPPSGNILIYYDATQSRWIGGDQASIFDVVNEVTPAQITANQNNYDPGLAEVLRLSTDAARTITGISGGVRGRYLRIFNIGSYPITLAYESGSSTAANRFKFSNGSLAVIPSNGNMLLYYDSTQARWVGADIQSSGSIYAQVSNAASQTIPFNVITKIDPGTAVSDQYGFYDDANNQFIITMGGVYNISVFGTWDVSVGNDTSLDFYLNGTATSEIFDHFLPNGTVLHQTQMTWIKQFSQGDVIDLRAYNNSEAGGYDLLSINTTLIKIA